MPPRNALSPAPYSNQLLNQVPSPGWEQRVAASKPPGYTMSEWLSELQYGFGKGLGQAEAGNLEFYHDVATRPVGVYEDLVAAAKAVAKNPSLVVNGLRAIGQQAASGPRGLGEVVGGFVNPRNFLKPKKAIMSQADMHESWDKSKYVKDNFEQRGEELIHVKTGNKIVGNKHVTLKDGTSINLLQTVDKYGDEGSIIALSPSGEDVGKLNYVIGQEGFHPDVFVQEPFRRKGLATSMYDLAEATGGVIPPYETKGAVRTPMGEAFRKNRAGR